MVEPHWEEVRLVRVKQQLASADYNGRQSYKQVLWLARYYNTTRPGRLFIIQYIYILGLQGGWENKHTKVTIKTAAELIS